MIGDGREDLSIVADIARLQSGSRDSLLERPSRRCRSGNERRGVLELICDDYEIRKKFERKLLKFQIASIQTGEFEKFKMYFFLFTQKVVTEICFYNIPNDHGKFYSLEHNTTDKSLVFNRKTSLRLFVLMMSIVPLYDLRRLLIKLICLAISLVHQIHQIITYNL